MEGTAELSLCDDIITGGHGGVGGSCGSSLRYGTVLRSLTATSTGDIPHRTGYVTCCSIDKRDAPVRTVAPLARTKRNVTYSVGAVATRPTRYATQRKHTYAFSCLRERSENVMADEKTEELSVGVVFTLRSAKD